LKSKSDRRKKREERWHVYYGLELLIAIVKQGSKERKWDMVWGEELVGLEGAYCSRVKEMGMKEIIAVTIFVW